MIEPHYAEELVEAWGIDDDGVYRRLAPTGDPPQNFLDIWPERITGTYGLPWGNFGVVGIATRCAKAGLPALGFLRNRKPWLERQNAVLETWERITE